MGSLGYPGSIAAAALSGLLACGGGNSPPPTPTGPVPVVTSFSPTAGYAGQVVAIQGSHFTGATAVTLGGRSTLFKVASDTRIDATPPSDGSTGPITVTNPYGTGSSGAAYTFQPVTADIVLAGGFEDAGAGNWVPVADGSPYRQVKDLAHGGAWYVILLGDGTGNRDEIYQDFLLPAGTGASLSYWTRITANAASSPSDRLTVEVRDPAGAVLGTLASYTPADASSVWVQRVADLSAYQGRMIRLAFKAQETTKEGTSFRVDDVSLRMVLPGVAGTAFNTSLANAYLVQSTQKADHSVPLVAGRDAWVRVFATANQPNIAQPPVQVTFQNGAATLGTLTLAAASSGLPTAVNEGFAALSYMGKVPGAWLQPGLRMTASLDPGATLLESTTSDNSLSIAFDVRVVPDFRITLFSISSASGQGLVTASNLDAWLDRFRHLYPVQTIDARFGGTFVTSQNLETGSQGGNLGGVPWAACAAELEAKRQTDGNGASRTYFGGVKVSYTSGIAGIAHAIPTAGSTTGWTCLGWDRSDMSDGGNFPEVLAHEVGHTLGRAHSPCGGASGPDPAYPYEQADIGVYGIDADTGVIKSPHGQMDIMGYCSPVWISDYVFKKVLDFRAALPAADPKALATPAAARPCLLVMGVMRAGELELQPAFTLDSHPTLPESGPYTLEGLDPEGRVLFSQAFAMHDLADALGADLKNFVFTLPLAPDRAAAVATLRVRHGDGVLAVQGRTAASQRGTVEGIAMREPVATRLADGGVYLSWDASRHPLVMMRDPATGAVLGFTREGDSGLKAAIPEVDLVFSDGVGGTQVRTRVQ